MGNAQQEGHAAQPGGQPAKERNRKGWIPEPCKCQSNAAVYLAEAQPGGQPAYCNSNAVDYSAAHALWEQQSPEEQEARHNSLFGKST
eukprot:985613-Pelagomonas_calceolata.AAC.3